VFSFGAIKNKKIYHIFIVTAVAVISLICALQLRNLRFDYDFEAFFPNEDHELELYNSYRETFEHDNEFILIAAENKNGIFQKDFLLKIDSLSKQLSEIEDVQQVSSPTNLKKFSFGGITPVQTPVLHFKEVDLYKYDSVEIYNSPHLVGSYFPKDGKSLSIFVKTREGLTKDQSDSLADRTKRLIDSFQFDNAHYVGRIFAQNVYLNNLKKEFTLFLCISFVLIVIFLWFSFKNLYGVIISVTVVLLSILWTLGTMSILGKSIDIMTTILPTMIFIAGMSDVVHYMSKYFDEMRSAHQGDIFKLIRKEVGFPTLLTLITTVVGFLSLLFSSIQPIRQFGIYTSAGVVIAFILTYTLLPAVLFLSPPKLSKVKFKKKEFITSNLLRSVFLFVFRNQKKILLFSGLVIVLAFIGISKIKVNNILLEDLNDKVKIKQDFQFFDKHFSGVRSLEIIISIKDPKKSIWNHDVIKQINSVDSFITQEFRAGFLISPASIVREIYRNSGNTTSDFPDKDDYQEIEYNVKANKKNKDIKKIVTEDNRKARISAKINDMGSIHVDEHNEALFNFIANQTDTSLIDFKLTGGAHLIDRNNKYMVSNMAKGFLFSIIIIGLITLLLHRSWRMAVVFIIPNLIPLFVIAGIMGYAHIELKAATALVFSIALGIATDDTIHFISRLKIERSYGKTILYALKRTFFETGKPIIITTFILIGGFMSLMISNFESTFYFGFLICITIIIALIADLLLLPVLLFRIYKDKKLKEE
jgi:uncharacterized protein